MNGLRSPGWQSWSGRRKLAVIGCAGVIVVAIAGAVAHSGGSSGNIGALGGAANAAPDYCKLQATWSTGAGMTIAEPLDTTVASSCDGLASDLTQNADGGLTVVSTGNLASVPEGICSLDNVTLLNVTVPETAAVACDGLEQNISYLTP
jgi:hypothetical protein